MKNTIHFRPGPQLTFKSVVVVRAKLSSALKAGTDADRFCLDLSEVKRCDSAGLALLIDARKLCKQYNKTFEAVGLSTATHSLAEFCGIERIFCNESQ